MAIRALILCFAVTLITQIDSSLARLSPTLWRPTAGRRILSDMLEPGCNFYILDTVKLAEEHGLPGCSLDDVVTTKLEQVTCLVVELKLCPTRWKMAMLSHKRSDTQSSNTDVVLQNSFEKVCVAAYTFQLWRPKCASLKTQFVRLQVPLLKSTIGSIPNGPHYMSANSAPFFAVNALKESYTLVNRSEDASVVLVDDYCYKLRWLASIHSAGMRGEVSDQKDGQVLMEVRARLPY